MMRGMLVGLVVSGCLAAEAAGGTQADFDALALAPESHWNGEPTVSMPAGFKAEYSTQFGPARFNTYYTVDVSSGWPFWAGWAYSNETDTTTGGYGNQFSAIPGGGQSGSTYGVAYYDTWTWPPTIPTVTWPQAATLATAYVTNTTYAYLSMHDGDAYAKKFGGSTGSDPDWFLLTITGKNGSAVQGTVEVYLADYRFADNSRDYILNTWTPVDLSGLGPVTSLEFTLSGSDLDLWGNLNTPAYFALDTLTPEPATLCLLAGGVGAVLLRRRSRHGGS
ncbi:MAG TPA: DUF4465 domain-containing protein [Phycisphaerae bacterium]|nr:DUF4465 domain-containing protein [Phycisphaerae bacterium]